MPTFELDDTIAAVSTPPGEGGIGVIRLSGPSAISIASRMFQSANGTALKNVASHTVHFGAIATKDNETIDQALVSVFKRPKSYTTQDVVEISAHGGSLVLRKILNEALSLGARQAEAGEFTRRAFLNGRIDLTQAEAIADLIRAKTDRAHHMALTHLKGKLSSEVTEIKEMLVKILAHLEAYLDFPDEHLEVYSNPDLIQQMNEGGHRLKRLINTFSMGELLRDGALVVIVGSPNAGKSSLLNVLLRRDRAIVSAVPGTTRDVIEESMDIDGCLIRISDTAGLSKSENPLDQAGMDRTKQLVLNGDLFIWMFDGHAGLRKEDEDIFELLQGKKVIALVNKNDLPSKTNLNRLRSLKRSGPIFQVSCKTGEGIEVLKKEIVKQVLKEELNQESVLLTRLRHKRALEAALKALKRSIAQFKKEASLEFVTVDLKQSLDQVYTEDLLDVIFSEFCIGK
jgi:tRNA modification GTPase